MVGDDVGDKVEAILMEEIRWSRLVLTEEIWSFEGGDKVGIWEVVLRVDIRLEFGRWF